IIVATLILIVTSLVLERQARRRLLARLRDTWGQPVERVRNMGAIGGFHRTRADESPDRGWLDDRTWDDLDLDAVFAVIDRAESTLGQQALYHRLRTAPLGISLDAFESLAGRFADESETRERAQIALARLQDPAGYDLWWLARPGSIETRPWHAVFPAICVAMLGSLLLAAVWPGALVIAFAGVAVNLVVRAATASRVGALVGSFRQVGPALVAAEALRFLDDAESRAIVGCLRDETRRLRRLKSIARWVSRPSAANGDLASIVLEYVNHLFLLDLNALYFGAGELNARGQSLLRVIESVGDVDAALAVASFRHGTPGWTRPRFQPAGRPMVLAEVRHPLIAHAVPNSIQLAPPHGVLVTGSNMSGKSTFIRTVGINAVLAQTIHTCLAASYEAPAMIVRTFIGRSDDLLAGKSYYIVEAESVLALVRASASRAPHLFLFDELFRGTNAVERIAAAEAVLVELVSDAAGLKPHVVLTATHDAELVDLLDGRYVPYHLEDRLGPDGIVFDYRLRPGPATTRNAIELLRLLDAPERLVFRALARAAALDAQRGAWSAAGNPENGPAGAATR
ncbi:MAG: hypothetical protein ABJC89_08810, partial [Acidobacteriota bacterium]